MYWFTNNIKTSKLVNKITFLNNTRGKAETIGPPFKASFKSKIVYSISSSLPEGEGSACLHVCASVCNGLGRLKLKHCLKAALKTLLAGVAVRYPCTFFHECNYPSTCGTPRPSFWSPRPSPFYTTRISL